MTSGRDARSAGTSPKITADTSAATAGEGDDGRVDRDAVHSRQVLWTSAISRSMPNLARRTPADRRQAREQQALNEQLPNQAQPAAAERGAHGKLALPRRRAHEQQVGDVRAGDQHHEADGAHQRQNHRPDVGDEILVHRLEPQEEAGGLLDRKLLAQTRGDRVNFLLRLLDGRRHHAAAR